MNRALIHLLVWGSVACGVIVPLVSGTAFAQAFLPPVMIGEDAANFMQTVMTPGAFPTGGALLICEGNPVPKSSFSANPFAMAHPELFLCGNTLPNFGISDVVGFLPGPGSELIQIASDADDPILQTADTTPITFPGVNGSTFVDAPTVAIAETYGPSGFIEYAPQDGGPCPTPPAQAVAMCNQPGFYVDPVTGETPLYYINSDCDGVLISCGPSQIPPQCGDAVCATLVTTGFDVATGARIVPTPEPGSLALAVLGLAVLLAYRYPLARVRFQIRGVPFHSVR
jgi:hypothetical protein